MGSDTKKTVVRMDATQVFAIGEYLQPCRRSASYRRLRRRCELGAVREHDAQFKERVAPPYAQKKSIPEGMLVRMEAPPRFELGHEGFADLCLTAWLWRRQDLSSIANAGTFVKSLPNSFFARFWVLSGHAGKSGGAPAGRGRLGATAEIMGRRSNSARPRELWERGVRTWDGESPGGNAPRGNPHTRPLPMCRRAYVESETDVSARITTIPANVWGISSTARPWRLRGQ